MTQSINKLSNSNSWFHYLAWLPIPIFLIIILFLAWFRPATVWNPLLLFTSLNIIFLTLIMIFVSILAIRSYLTKSSLVILLLGSGSLALGLGGLIAGIAILGNNPNSTVSIYNTSACISGIFILASAILSISIKTKILRSLWPLSTSYVGVIVLIGFVAFLVRIHVWPLYFVEGTGPTTIDLAVLYTTIILFVVSAILLLFNSIKDNLNFRIWYGLGLGLIAIGLLAVSLQKDIGDALNWVGRISQYLGAVYILIAIISSIRETGIWLLPWQQSLYEMEEKYHSLFTSMNEGVAIHRILFDKEDKAVDYIVMDVNPAYEKILGLKREDVFDKKATEIYRTPNPPYLDVYSLVAKTRNPKTFETYFGPMNKYFKISVTSPEKGKFITVFDDITERKEKENILKEREEKFSSLFENSIDAVLLTIPDGTILDANPAAEKMFGYTKKEILNMGLNGLIDTKDPNLPILLDVRETKSKAQVELKLIKKDGTIFQTETSTNIFQDRNGNKRSSMIIRDINKRKQIEADLKRSERSLAEAQHIAHIGSWEWNIKTGEITWSNELYSIYRVDPNTFTPTLSSFGEYMHPDDEEYVNKHVDQLLIDSKSHNFDFRIVLDDGSIRVLNTLAEVTEFDENAKPSIIVGINQDITERKEIELKLNENIKKLAQSNKELEQFAYITSHDLREPLRMITSFLQLLERRYKDQLDQDANEYIMFAVDGAKRLDAMTNDLLQYSRISSEKREIIPVNFEHVLEHALTNMKVQIEENNAIITHDPLPIIKGDEQLKIQLFQNLIGNAIKYRSQETPKIHISAKKEKNQYLFSVKDNGIGMSPEYLEQIFTIFKRLHTHDEYEGTGIGLAIAQKIVHQQGGQIWAESEPGKGSTFYFTIPIKD